MFDLPNPKNTLRPLFLPRTALQVARRPRRYTNPTLLCVDEVGYPSYDARYAELLFEMITRGYQLHRPMVLAANKPCREWNQVFRNADCVVALVDRLLVHCSESLTPA